MTNVALQLSKLCNAYIYNYVNLQLNIIKTRHSYFENFEAKTGQNWVIANMPPKYCSKKFIGLQLN